MKIIAFSDSHGSPSAMAEAIRKHRSADVVVFCGDGCSDLTEIRSRFNDKHFIAVRGNCDWYCSEPYTQDITLAGKKILVTHGHLFGVKQGYDRIIDVGHNEGADIVIFGHTHHQLTSVEGGMLLVNPGSVGYGRTYTIIEINEDTGKIKAVEYPHDDYGPVIL